MDKRLVAPDFDLGDRTVVMSLTICQQSNHSGFPKAAELIEIEGGHRLEASDRR